MPVTPSTNFTRQVGESKRHTLELTQRIAVDPADPRSNGMADDLLNRGGPDRSRINLYQDHELKYWTRHLGVTADELKRAVERVGDTAAAVRKQLRLGRPRKVV